MPEVIRLTVQHRVLHFPRGGTNYDAKPVKFDCPDTPALLVRYYDSGDCDTIAWPLPRAKAKRESALRNLAYALFDQRECNDLFPRAAVIELPDGTVFDFDDLVR